MPIQILMPALSPTMEEGKIARWLKKEGDRVEPGDIIAEIETDKATMEYEATDEGTLAKILVPEGAEGVKVNTPIALLLEEGEDAAALEAAGAGTAPAAGAAAPAAPAAADSTSAASTAAAAAPRASAPAAPAPAGAVGGSSAAAGAAQASSAAAPASAAPGGRRIFASPLARRLARELGIDLAQITGSGPHGRIVKADVERAAAAPRPAAAPGAPAAAPRVPAGPALETLRRLYEGRTFEELALDNMRRTIAERLVEAKQTIPHFYLRRSFRIDALLDARARLNARLEGRGVKLSVNDFIIRAAALALQDVPDCNVVFAGDRILRFRASDVAVAVAVEGGLFTPVIRDAERKSLAEISTEMKDLAARARARRLAPHEYQGGAFAISNLGMFGIENFDAVINPPHASILAVGAGLRQPVVKADGTIGAATMMSVTLSVDHRAIDGALGARFLEALGGYLEDPVTMLA